LNLHVRRAVAQSLAEVDYLTPDGKTALLQLAKDPDTAEFTREALQVHDLDAIHPLPAKEANLKGTGPEIFTR
jgi:hypothetical protein